ncbi:hypothetical protein HF325_001329 [Metschnikowia pulcherrima]|uniref:Uncharacterized protein n=1 Tax=Metschnikowia pulcherrima TaxID=27326 RepID=A0A8H7LBG5_9ASCO|nr:hypothetical protein HF325_001329 [Metschnikowia pulcherrima]
MAKSIKDGRLAEPSDIKNVHYIVEDGGLVDMPRVTDMQQSPEMAISMVSIVPSFYMQLSRRTDDTIDW